MKDLVVETVPVAAADGPFEIVERKGVGHPDTICDGVAEACARALARAYLDLFGRPQHFNLDKALLAAGVAEPAFGGGHVLEPMRLVLGDRAVSEAQGKTVPVGEIFETATRAWFRKHLRFVDVARHLVVDNAVRPGSPELVGIFAGEEPRANDTSVAVGFAPLTETERLVLEAERFLNDRSFKERFPEAGEDVKVMGVRRERRLGLTVALAFVDRFVFGETAYFERKKAIAEELEEHLRERLETLDGLSVRINTLDEPGRGAAGAYLTVTGTSAEGGDSGQVGRGNWLSGFFSTARPASNEAVAGKNPYAHIGKVYNALAYRIAERIALLDAVREAVVHLVSRIGAPLSEPQFAAVRLVLEPGARREDVEGRVAAVVDEAFRTVGGYADAWLAADELAERR